MDRDRRTDTPLVLDRTDLALRPVEAADAPFLAALFAEARGGDFAALPAALAATILAQQEAIQRAHFAATWPEAEVLLIEHRKVAVGRLILAEDGDALRLVDIAIAIAARNQGIGTALIAAAIDRAQREGRRALALAVRPANTAARRLYLRLGFIAAPSDSDPAAVIAMERPLAAPGPTMSARRPASPEPA